MERASSQRRSNQGRYGRRRERPLIGSQAIGQVAEELGREVQLLLLELLDELHHHATGILQGVLDDWQRARPRRRHGRRARRASLLPQKGLVLGKATLEVLLGGSKGCLDALEVGHVASCARLGITDVLGALVDALAQRLESVPDGDGLRQLRLQRLRSNALALEVPRGLLDGMDAVVNLLRVEKAAPVEAGPWPP